MDMYKVKAEDLDIGKIEVGGEAVVDVGVVVEAVEE